MTVLIVLGMVLFVGIHLVPLNHGLRRGLQQRLGTPGYLALFSLLSLAGLVIAVIGFRGAEFEPLWSPPAFARGLTMALMPFAFILWVAAYLPTHLRRLLKHPMLLGIVVWSSVHLLANGDLASTIIFASLLLYAVIDMALTHPRDSLIPKGQPRWLFDLAAVVIGLLAYAGAMHAHQWFAGVALIG